MGRAHGQSVRRPVSAEEHSCETPDPGVSTGRTSPILDYIVVYKLVIQSFSSTGVVAMPRFLRSLFGQVVLALVLGVVIGLLWPDSAVKLKPLGDGFIKLIKMIIPVIVFCVVVHGIAGAGDLKRVGRVGVKALIYF